MKCWTTTACTAGKIRVNVFVTIEGKHHEDGPIIFKAITCDRDNAVLWPGDISFE